MHVETLEVNSLLAFAVHKKSIFNFISENMGFQEVRFSPWLLFSSKVQPVEKEKEKSWVFKFFSSVVSFNKKTHTIKECSGLCGLRFLGVDGLCLFLVELYCNEDSGFFSSLCGNCVLESFGNVCLFDK